MRSIQMQDNCVPLDFSGTRQWNERQSSVHTESQQP